MLGNEVQATEMRFSGEVLDVTLRGKPRSCDIRKALHFKPILWIRRSAATVCPCGLNASWKVCEESAAGSTQTKTTHRTGKRQVGWLHSQPGLVAPRYGACRTIRSYWRTVVRLDNAGTFCLSEVVHFNPLACPTSRLISNILFLVTLRHKNGVCRYSF